MTRLSRACPRVLLPMGWLCHQGNRKGNRHFDQKLWLCYPAEITLKSKVKKSKRKYLTSAMKTWNKKEHSIGNCIVFQIHLWKILKEDNWRHRSKTKSANNAWTSMPFRSLMRGKAYSRRWLRRDPAPTISIGTPIYIAKLNLARTAARGCPSSKRRQRTTRFMIPLWWALWKTPY